MITTGSLSYLMLSKYANKFGRIEVNKKLHIKLFLMSILFMLNIVIGNAGIRYCSLAFVQVYNEYCNY